MLEKNSEPFITILLLVTYAQIHLPLLNFHGHFIFISCALREILLFLDCLSSSVTYSAPHGGILLDLLYFNQFSLESIFVCYKYMFVIFKETLRNTADRTPGGEPVAVGVARAQEPGM